MTNIHRLGRIAALCALSALTSCAEPTPAATTPDRRTASEPPSPSTASPEGGEPTSPPTPVAAVIAPGRQAPPFELRSTDGELFDSTELVGQRPFVVVLFATWCRICHLKVPLVQRVLDEVGDGIVTIGVALDDSERWDDVAAFVERYGLSFPIVRGDRHAEFVSAYGPTGGVPAVVVVAGDGMPVEYQLGIAPNDPVDLATALLYVNQHAVGAPPREPR